MHWGRHRGEEPCSIFHGNDYRLIARVNYRTKRVFILYILTHVEYSKGEWKR